MEDLPRENKKLQYLIDTYAKGSQNAFAELIGVSQANINRLFRKDDRNNEYPNVIKSKSTLTAINNKYDFATIEWFKKEDSIELKSLNNNNQKSSSKPKSTYTSDVGRPFYDTDFTLGFEELDNDSSISPEFNIDFPPANKEGINWFRGKGNSMLGEINSGDYIALEEIPDFSWFPLGRIYGVVTKNGFRTIKRITKSENNDNYSLISSNPDKEEYPDQDIPKDIIKKLFKVVFVIKDLDE